MEINDILTLLHAVSESNITNFEYQEGSTRLSFQAGGKEIATQVHVNEHGIERQTTTLEPVKDVVETGHVITSPMVGTFYSAPGEDSSPFIKVGDTIKKGQVIGIVEAMKLMNEIESPYEGVVDEILVENGDMIGFEQPLVRIR